MTHLSDERLTELGRAGGQLRDAHLAGCPRCQARLAAWRNLTDATTTVATELTGPVVVPSFDSLLGPVLAAQPTNQPIEVTAPGFGASWRLTAALVFRQFLLIPRALVPCTVLGLLAAVLLVPAVPNPVLAERFFGAAVSLVVMIGSVAICTRRTDPRLELLSTMLVSPATVFAARLALILSIDLVLALAASVAMRQLGAFPTVFDVTVFGVVSQWLGQALLASAIGVACAVWKSPLVGGAVGATVWFLCSASTLPSGVLSVQLGPVVSHVWATTPWTLAAALLVLALAVRTMGTPRIDPPLA